MKSKRQRNKTRSNHLKAITLTLLLHAAIIGGLLYAYGDLGNIFQKHSDPVENMDSDILSKALANTKPG